MPVWIVAGEEGFGAAAWAEQGAADFSEGQRAGGISACGGACACESALQLGDALAEGGVGEVQEPADFSAGVAGEGEEGGDAERGG